MLMDILDYMRSTKYEYCFIVLLSFPLIEIVSLATWGTLQLMSKIWNSMKHNKVRYMVKIVA